MGRVLVLLIWYMSVPVAVHCARSQPGFMVVAVWLTPFALALELPAIALRMPDEAPLFTGSLMRYLAAICILLSAGSFVAHVLC
jgi:hypothetical protein